MKEVIYFAHANGFPGACYRKFYQALSNDFIVSYLDSVGHHPNYPVTDNWDFLVHELIADIEIYHQQPVIGVGHSLGGVLHFLASHQRPDLYKAVVMLDAPIFGRFKSAMVQVMKWLGTIDKITPAARTKSRRQSWPDAQSAIDYLKTRPLFHSFDPECLADYVEYGMDHTDDGVRLRFAREVEYTIYRTMPHNLGQYGHRRQVPTGLLYGESTDVIEARDIAYMQKVLHIHTQITRGGHLFPFEFPEQAAQDVTELVKKLNMIRN
jgi:pimeloyl-ACP methyl ester carboxylesterase